MREKKSWSRRIRRAERRGCFTLVDMMAAALMPARFHMAVVNDDFQLARRALRSAR